MLTLSILAYLNHKENYFSNYEIMYKHTFIDLDEIRFWKRKARWFSKWTEPVTSAA